MRDSLAPFSIPAEESPPRREIRQANRQNGASRDDRNLHFERRIELRAWWALDRNFANPIRVEPTEPPLMRFPYDGSNGKPVLEDLDFGEANGPQGIVLHVLVTEALRPKDPIPVEKPARRFEDGGVGGRSGPVSGHGGGELH